MGCDIHAHVEVKIDGQWHHYSAPKSTRLYDMFAKMAGVRQRDGEVVTPIVPIRGIPGDATVITNLEYIQRGGHSATWMDCDEFARLEAWHGDYHTQSDEYCYIERHFGYLFGNSIGGLKRWPGDYPSCIEDVRLVFWFAG